MEGKLPEQRWTTFRPFPSPPRSLFVREQRRRLFVEALCMGPLVVSPRAAPPAIQPLSLE